MDIHLYIINLDERKDKYEETINELSKLNLEKYNLKIERFSAIKHEKGWIGCALSHISILEIANQENLEWVIVIEDDNSFNENQIKNIEKTFDWLFSNKEKWEIFMGNQSFVTPIDVFSAKFGIINSIGKTTNFMIYQKSIYSSIIAHKELYINEINNEKKRNVNPIDRIIRNKLLVTRYPFITTQRVGFSDIEQRVITYQKKIKKSEHILKKFILNFIANFVKNKKILVLDYNNVLTHAFQKIFKQNQYFEFIYVNIKDINFLDYQQVYNKIKSIDPYYIINGIEISMNIFQTHMPNINLLHENNIINFNILEAAHQNNVNKVVSILSNSIFSNNENQELYREPDILQAIPHSSSSQYAYSKIYLNNLSQIYRKKYGRNFICVLPVDYYGPGSQDIDVSKSKVIPSIIHKYLNAQNNKENFIWLNQCEGVTRQFIFSYDLVKLLFWVLIDYKKSDTLILSTNDQEISIKKLGNMISRRIFKREIEQKIGHKYAKGINRKSVSNQLLRYYIPDFTFTPLYKGLSITIQWIKDNYSLLTNQVIDQNEVHHDEEVKE
jgi:GDP-L-fucose synthase